MVSVSTDPDVKRLQSILRHVEGVRQDCEILGLRLIERGEFDFGRDLIARGLIHDESKFHGVEWDHLGVSDDPFHQMAWEYHVANNSHHPEFHHGIHLMPRLDIAEMVCDWHSRSSELGTSLPAWIVEGAMPRFHFSPGDDVAREIDDFVSLLLDRFF
jgi:hypothetical protein